MGGKNMLIIAEELKAYTADGRVIYDFTPLHAPGETRKLASRVERTLRNLGYRIRTEHDAESRICPHCRVRLVPRGRKLCWKCRHDGIRESDY
jgi:hypothetical protein